MTERWVVTQVTEHGARQMWWVDEETAHWVMEEWDNIGQSSSSWSILRFCTLTGKSLIWLTPGQSLTVEKEGVGRV